MKKIAALILLSCFIVCLAACGNGQEVSENTDTDSSVSQISGESKPWYDTSAPENYVSVPAGEVSDEADESDYSVGENSAFTDESIGETSENSYPVTDIGDYSTLPISGSVYRFNNNASAYSVVFTKNSDLAAAECITNTISSVTAVYDGSVTRFFGAVDGTYYCTVFGKYLYPCCDGGFISGDLSAHNAADSVVVELDSETQTYTAVKNPSDAHAHGSYGGETAFYSPLVGLSFELYEGELSRHPSDGYAVCRLYEGQNVLESYNSGALFSSEFESMLGKYGVVKDNKVVIPFEYDAILSANTGSCGVFLAVKDGRCYYFSASGVNLTPDGFDCGSQPFSDRAWVFEDGRGWIIKFS